MSDPLDMFKLSKKYVGCHSGMVLWTSLNLLGPRVVENRKPTRQEIKDFILAFPKKTQGCKCKECRYFRWVKKHD